MSSQQPPGTAPGQPHRNDQADLIVAILQRCGMVPDATALTGPGGRGISFGRLRTDVLAVAGSLAAAGLERGDGVLFSVRPSPDAVILALGVVTAGGTVILADPGAGPALFGARMTLARPRWAIAESLLYALSGRSLRALTPRRLRLPDYRRLDVRHVRAGPWLPGVPRGALPSRALLRGTPITADVVPGAPDDAAVVVFTSGTVQRPRAVVHTRSSLAAAMALFGICCPLGPGDTVHTDQLMVGLPALALGAHWSMPPPRFEPRRFAKALAERRATHTFCVPADATALLDALGERRRLPDSLRWVLLGAAPVPPSLQQRVTAATATGTRVLAVYGMTEILPVATVDGREKLGHAAAGAGGDLLGTPLPGVRARVAADGELWLSGPNLCRGYLGDEPVTEHATGDLVRIDAQGRLVMLGRKKDMIIRGRVNVYPALYEPAIAARPDVTDAAMVGVADPTTGDERIVLLVTAAAGEDPARLAATLRRALPALIDTGAIPDEVRVLPRMPYAGRSRKLDRDALRQIAAARP